jgi:hypothetical protein
MTPTCVACTPKCIRVMKLYRNVVSMCSCRPGGWRVHLFSIGRVIAINLVKLCNFQLVSHVVQNEIDLES